MEFPRKKKFIATDLGPEEKIFVVYKVCPAILNASKIYLFCKAQIVFLQVDETAITIFLQCFNFADVWSNKPVRDLLDYMGENDHAIYLVDGYQLPYGLIYNLRSIKLEK